MVRLNFEDKKLTTVIYKSRNLMVRLNNGRLMMDDKDLQK